MAWTYDPANIATTALYQLRWLIGDTLTKDPLIQDEELTWAISQRTSIYGAAADACRSLAGRMSREADTSQGPMHTAYSARARNFRAMAGAFEVMAMVRSAGVPYSGQVSQTDYDLMIADPDRMGPEFYIGMQENYLPVGAAKQEKKADGA